MNTPIGTITADGAVTCTLCPWTADDRLDPVGALTAHRTTNHHDAHHGAAPTARRHLPGVVLGLALLGLFGFLTVAAWTAGGWWILAALPCAPVALLGLYGATTDAQRVPRDRRGRRT